jgi:hypothetical protein
MPIFLININIIYRKVFFRYDSVDATDTRKAVEQMEGFLKSVDQTVDKTPKTATGD